MTRQPRTPLSDDEEEYLSQMANGNALARQRKRDRERRERENRKRMNRG
ncbi:hypothetical protein [Aidingimonas lacisalsi]|nr:hypothetical protein [Aidingimonas lacisalsi]